MLDIPEGKLLGGRYRIGRTLGSGGMAVVYEARDSVLGRRVALKVLHGQYAGDPGFKRRFMQEARAMASLDHENIVKVYDISQEGEMSFIVAEYVNGRTLDQLLSERGVLDERTARRIGAQLLRALSYAHRRGIVHRDIKPSNVLLTVDGTVKVGDFGIARIMKDSEEEAGELVGSARYISPEQLQGEEATPRSDLYSVGVLLYRSLTGQAPFDGDIKTISHRQVSERPVEPRRLNREVSRQLEAVVMRALAKEPANRYPSANAMLDDLRPAPAGLASGGTQGGYRHLQQGSMRHSRRGLFILSTLIVLVLLGGGGTALGFGLLGSSGGEDAGGSLGAASPVENTTLTAPQQPERNGNNSGTVGNDSKNNETTGEKTSAQKVPVPEVVPYYDYSAREILRNDGLEAEVVYRYKEGYANRGVAWGTEPAAGTMVPKGTTVTVYATPKDQPQPRY